MLKRSNRACTFTKPLTVTEALQSLAPSSSATRRLRGVLEQPSTPPGYATALGQETVATRFKIDLGLAELHNVRDSVAPRSYVDLRSQAFSDSWAWLHKARSYIG